MYSMDSLKSLLICGLMTLSWTIAAPVAIADEAIGGPVQNKVPTIAYWTPARMQEAERHPDEIGDFLPERPPITPGGDRLGYAEAPLPYVSHPVARITGELFFYDPVRQINNHCTASVVKSRSQSLLITAAHCVMTPIGPAYTEFRWNAHLLFVPAYNGRLPATDEHRAPFGVWPIRQAYMPRYLSENPGYIAVANWDLAIVSVFDQLGRTIEEIVGEGFIPIINENGTSYPLVNDIGYPGIGPYDGKVQHWCASEGEGGRGLRLPNCRTVFGNSGGPVLIGGGLPPIFSGREIVAVESTATKVRLTAAIYPALAELADSEQLRFFKKHRASKEGEHSMAGGSGRRRNGVSRDDTSIGSSRSPQT